MCGLSDRLTSCQSLSEALVIILKFLDGVLEMANKIYGLLENSRLLELNKHKREQKIKVHVIS